MAKAGFWLRGAKGKLAGASMGKGANGQTIMREIVTPRNPKTNAQMIQRAIMATVMRAYSAGSEIFDHSFQGYAKGSNNQHRFVKLNANRLRSIVANDLNNAVAVAEQKGRVVAPGVQQFVPFEMIISEGTYAQNFMTIDTSRGSASHEVVIPTKKENEKVSEYADRCGLLPGDIYTVVLMSTDVDKNREALYSTPGIDSSLGKVFKTKFAWVRLTVKSDVLENENAITANTNLTNSQIFDVEYSAGLDVEGFEHLSGLGGGNYISALLHSNYGCTGIIRSRKDADLRSTTNLVVDFGNGEEVYFGIASQYITTAWKAGAQSVGDSEYILEGADEGRVLAQTNPGGGD